MNKNNKSETNTVHEKSIRESKNFELQQFVQLIDQQKVYLGKLARIGKGQFAVNHKKILTEWRSLAYDAYLSKTISYPEFKQLNEFVRSSFNLETLLGFKQLSIFDELPDEYFGPDTNPDNLINN